MLRDGAFDVTVRVLRLARAERGRVVVIVLLGLLSAVFEGDATAAQLILSAAIFLSGLARGIVTLVLSIRLSLIVAERLRAEILEGRHIKRSCWLGTRLLARCSASSRRKAGGPAMRCSW